MKFGNIAKDIRNETDVVVSQTPLIINNGVIVPDFREVIKYVEVPVEIEKIVYLDKIIEVPVEIIKYVDVVKEVPVVIEKVVMVEAAAPPPQIIEKEVIKYVDVVTVERVVPLWAICTTIGSVALSLVLLAVVANA